MHDLCGGHRISAIAALVPNLAAVVMLVIFRRFRPAGFVDASGGDIFQAKKRETPCPVAR